DKTFALPRRARQHPSRALPRSHAPIVRALRSRRSCHAETFCPPERLWRAHRVISPDHSQQNSKDKVGRGLSSFLIGPSPNPNKGAQTKRLCEIFGGSSDSIRKSPKNARFAFPNRRAVDRSRARRRDCPN